MENSNQKDNGLARQALYECLSGRDNGAGSAGSFPATPLSEAMKLVEADKEHRSLAADQVLMLRSVMPQLTAGLKQLSEGIFRWCQHQGFWPAGWMGLSYEGSKLYRQTVDGRVTNPTEEDVRLKKAEKIALMHTELSELLEGIRADNRENEAEECADLMIRLLDYCGAYGIDLGLAVERKMYKNYQRPFRHGKAF